ncbi:hypothetical protein ABT075_25890 [Streptomyces sp. NPDC002677]
MYHLCIACFLLDLAYAYALFAVHRTERAAAARGEAGPVAAVRARRRPLP